MLIQFYFYEMPSEAELVVLGVLLLHKYSSAKERSDVQTARFPGARWLIEVFDMGEKAQLHVKLGRRKFAVKAFSFERKL